MWANTPVSSAYVDLRDLVVGPEALHLDLSLGTWAADGLLAMFFFVAGLELKREFVAGDLRDPRRAALPVAAAVGGMVVPAAGLSSRCFAGRRLPAWLGDPHRDRHRLRPGDPRRHQHALPVALRTFLLTLAVVDDLLAITVIALFYTDTLDLGSCRWPLLPLVASRPGAASGASRVPAPAAGPGHLGTRARVGGARDRGRRPAGLGRAGPRREAPPAAAWPSASSTGYGRCRRRSRCRCSRSSPRESRSAESNGVREALSDPVALGVVLGLVLGKSVGVAGSTWLLAHLHPRRPRRRPGLARRGRPVDAGGVGFTVSLLIGELAFGTASEHDDTSWSASWWARSSPQLLCRDHPAAPQPDLPPDLRGRGARR